MYSIHWMVLLVVGLVEGRGTYIQIPKEFIDDSVKASVHCADELGLPVDTLNKFLSNVFEDSLAMRKYIYCLGSAVDVGDENGNLKHSLSKYARTDKRKAEVIKTVDECNKEEASDKYEKAYKVSTCFLNTSPVQFKL
uniref:Odorant binding protein 10 n=1 Tax=Heliconius charithonia TaxID=33434 RepID=A0AA49EZV9_HELCH|nr:odorant binding protein 10 [Heliconius charithonia]